MSENLPLRGVILIEIIGILTFFAFFNHMDNLKRNIEWFSLVTVSAFFICEILCHWFAKRRDYTACPKSKEEIALTQIEKIGYQWAKEPWHTSGIYIYARDVKVAPVGHHPGPDGAILYKAADVEMFFWNGHTTHAVIDVCNRVHIKPDSMGLLAVDDGKLIIPDDAYIIRNFKEAEDFIDFFHLLKKYKNPKALTTKAQDYTWDTEQWSHKNGLPTISNDEYGPIFNRKRDKQCQNFKENLFAGKQILQQYPMKHCRIPNSH